VNQQPSERSGFQRRSQTSRSVHDCQMVENSIEEYALGILDPEQQAAIERHLDFCPVCSNLIVGYRQVATALALAVPVVAPPLRARTMLMARIDETPRKTVRPVTMAASTLESLRTPTLPASAPVAPMPVGPQEQSAWWRVYAAPLATLPLILALGLVAAWGFNNYTQLHDSRTELASRDLQIARLSSQLSTDNSQNVANLLVSPSSKRYTLAPQATGIIDSARGTLIADSQSGQAAVQVSGLPAGTYTVVVQLQNGNLVPTAEFEVGPQGSATTLLDLGSQVGDLDSVHIRATTSVTQTDVAAIEAQRDVLMTTIGPNISDDSDTSVQKP